MKTLRLRWAAAALAVSLAAPSVSASARTLVVGVDDNLTLLDPADINDTLSQSATRLIYQGLYGFDAAMHLEPLLAESFEVNGDATVYTFHLRKGVTFHDGTAFDAQAVKINVDRVANPDNRLKRQSMLSTVDHTEVVDPSTVRIYLKRPFGALVNTMAHAATFMISPAALEKYGHDIGRHPVGTGPYRFKSWAGDTLETVRNDHYWKAGLPKVDGVTFKSVPENGSRVAMLKAGEAQLIFPVPPELVPVIANDKTLQLDKAPSIVVRFVSLNIAKKPFDDVRVRQALNYAIDKTAYCKVVYSGFCTPADTPLPVPLKFSVSQGVWPYDPAKAKALLAEAGYTKGFESEIVARNNSTFIRGMQFIQQQLAEIGVKLTVTPLEAGVEAQRIWGVEKPADSTVLMNFNGWSSSTGDADWALRPLFWSKGFPPKLFNAAYYKNDAVDAALEAGIGTADDDKRAVAYKTAQDLIWKDAPWIFLGVDQIISAKSKSLSGAVVLPDRSLNFEQALFRD
ncbi:glutathione ABC transporter substrate-binding protein [Telmatospirillum sp.]|uniref:glutathione ABC transporter substrate-binding protein n=1 Tax=Telmatospirillum sp. TaxID=2079197 RepID=UPI002848E74A|nr:glutathione ABC transporter substrate-binding protein [Telmatospirillum sp.]MDR3437369.1 glutathione ABC transporter substrate-binding protein [Telmatospirillum sp.]